MIERTLSIELQTAITAVKQAATIIMDEFDTMGTDSNNSANIAISKAYDAMVLSIKEKNNEYNIVSMEGDFSVGKSPITWIIHPLGGKNNFFAKRDSFSVSVAITEKGKPHGSIIMLPKRNEFYACQIGVGAFLNGKQLYVKKGTELDSAIVTYSAYPGSEHLLQKNAKKKISNIKEFSFLERHVIDPDYGKGSMAAEFCDLSKGTLQGIVRYQQNSWDVFAGSILAQCAGYTVLDNCKNDKHDIIAANPNIVYKLQEVFK